MDKLRKLRSETMTNDLESIFYVNARFLTQKLTGVQRYAIETCRQIKKQSPKVVFLAPTNILHKEIARELEVQIIGRNTGTIWEQWDLYRFMSSKKNILLNLCNSAPLWYRNNMICIHDLAYIFYPKSFSFLFRTWYRFMQPAVIRKAQHLFTVSQTVLDELTTQFSLSQTKITVTKNGISAFFLQRELPLTWVKEKFILCVGALNPRKNLPTVFRVFKQIQQQYPNYQLVCIVTDSNIFTQQKFPFMPNVICLDSVSDDELASWYQRAEVFVSLSAYEGFNLPILEALFFQCQVLCSDIPVHRELYQDSVYFCDIQNESSIQLSLLKILKDQPKILENKITKPWPSYSHSAKIIRQEIQAHENRSHA